MVKWLYCNNVELSVVHWPKGARDMYMLFFERTTTDSTTRKTPSKHDIKLDNAPVNPVKHKVCDENNFKKVLLEKTCPFTTEDCALTGFDMPVVRTEWPEYRYFPVDEEWQSNACRQLGLRFVRPFECTSGGPNVVLTRPITTSLKRIGGDGNCLYRSFSYIITGSEAQHFELRSAIVAHMLLICCVG